MVGVIASHNPPGPELWLQKFEDIEVKTLGSIEEDHINVAGWIGQGFQGIADAKLNPLLQTSGGKVALCLLCFLEFEFGRDDLARPIVTDR